MSILCGARKFNKVWLLQGFCFSFFGVNKGFAILFGRGLRSGLGGWGLPIGSGFCGFFCTSQEGVEPSVRRFGIGFWRRKKHKTPGQSCSQHTSSVLQPGPCRPFPGKDVRFELNCRQQVRGGGFLA